MYINEYNTVDSLCRHYVDSQQKLNSSFYTWFMIDIKVSYAYYILSIFHNLGIPRSYRTLNFDLMSSRNMYLYNAYIYTYILF